MPIVLPQTEVSSLANQFASPMVYAASATATWEEVLPILVRQLDFPTVIKTDLASNVPTTLSVEIQMVVKRPTRFSASTSLVFVLYATIILVHQMVDLSLAPMRISLIATRTDFVPSVPIWLDAVHPMVVKCLCRLSAMSPQVFVLARVVITLGDQDLLLVPIPCFLTVTQMGLASLATLTLNAVVPMVVWWVANLCVSPLFTSAPLARATLAKRQMSLVLM